MFQLPQLKFNPENLLPAISSETVTFHYGKHHSTYVNNLNKLVEDNSELQNLSLEEIIMSYKTFSPSIQTAVLNNAGQVFNHNLYWECITDKEQDKNISDSFLATINSSFGSLEDFKKQFEQLGLTQFGSGWAWLAVNKETKELVLSKTSNAENPLMFGQTPILTIDVWEHAYYLGYQNRRADYLKDMWNIVDWAEVERKYLEIL